MKKLSNKTHICFFLCLRASKNWVQVPMSQCNNGGNPKANRNPEKHSKQKSTNSSAKNCNLCQKYGAYMSPTTQQVYQIQDGWYPQAVEYKSSVTSARLESQMEMPYLWNKHQKWLLLARRNATTPVIAVPIPNRKLG